MRRTGNTVLILIGSILAVPAAAAQFHLGDVFAAVGDADLDGQAEIFHYRADGTFVETLQFGSGIDGRSTGMAFDAEGNLLATALDRSKILRFDNHGNNLGVFIGSGLSFPECIVFDSSGDFYVSSVLNPVGIKKFDAEGDPLAELIPGTRVDWMDLAADQRTMLFTSETNPILRLDVSQPDGIGHLVTTDGTVFALRFLLDGRILVANKANIKLLSSTGETVRTYDVAGEDLWFAVNLDPDGRSFWSGNIETGRIFKFDIGCGGAANCTTFTQMIATGVPTEQPTRALAGVAIYGELTASCPDRPPALPTPELGRVVVPRLDPARPLEGSVTRLSASAMIGRCPSGSFCLAR